MTSRARRASAASSVPDRADVHLVRSERWHGLKAGDPVHVTGEPGRGVAFEFVAHVVNTRSGAEWIEVVGGRSGERAFRSFDPERIYPPASSRRSGRAARPSLATAPQLPLD
ncbi:MAG: DUF7246 family protein [Acidimicrobiales bacterium]